MIKKSTNGVLIKLKTLTEAYSARVDVNLRDRISNTVVQTLEALYSLLSVSYGEIFILGYRLKFLKSV